MDTSSTWRVRQYAVGEQLRLLRTREKYTLEQAALAIHCSMSMLSRVENGYRSLSIEDVASLLTLYRADATHRARVLKLAGARDNEIGWLQPRDPAAALSAVESQAEQTLCYDPVAIPRMLQTSTYRAAITGHPDTPPDSAPDPGCPGGSPYRPAASRRAIVEESVLSRPFGGPAVMRRQLEHLRTQAVQGPWSVQVLPREHTIATGAFTLLRLPTRLSVVILDHPTCRLFLERPEDVHAYEHLQHNLEERALNQADSLALITSVATQWNTGPEMGS